MNISKITLAQLITSPNEIIKRNAMSILKQLQNCKHPTDIWSNGHLHCLTCDEVLDRPDRCQRCNNEPALTLSLQHRKWVGQNCYNELVQEEIIQQ